MLRNVNGVCHATAAFSQKLGTCVQKMGGQAGCCSNRELLVLIERIAGASKKE
jgi:hypothetical protein